MHLNNLFGQFRIALSPLGLLFLASALCSQAPGQTISSGATASAAKPPLSSIPEGLFREFGGLIQLDVVVKDSTGTPVAGLDSSRFVVLDNRQPREIRGFVAHGSDAKPDPPVGLILALDLVDMAPEPASRAKEEISKFLQRNGGHLANPVSIFAITSPGLFSSIGPSSDGNGRWPPLLLVLKHRPSPVWVPIREIVLPGWVTPLPAPPSHPTLCRSCARRPHGHDEKDKRLAGSC